MFALFAGLAAGLLHVFSGPDHLAAVAPLALHPTTQSPRGVGPGLHPTTQSPRGGGPGVEGWRTGLQWGVGHTAGILLIATLLLVLKEQLPLDAISAYSERLVGVSLVMVGAWGMWKATRAFLPAHSHPAASLAMGAVHGLAGSSHLFVVVPALAFSARVDSLLYLCGFGAGAVVGMSAFTAGIGLLSARSGRDHRRGHSRLLYASSAMAFLIGGVWLAGH